MGFRVGLIADLELRLKTYVPGRARAMIGDLSQTESGFSSPVVEVKWKFLDVDKTRLALLFSADLEAGTKAFRPHKIQPAVNFASDFSLGGSYSLNTNLGVGSGHPDPLCATFLHGSVVAPHLFCSLGLHRDLRHLSSPEGWRVAKPNQWGSGLPGPRQPSTRRVAGQGADQ